MSALRPFIRDHLAQAQAAHEEVENCPEGHQLREFWKGVAYFHSRAASILNEEQRAEYMDGSS